MLARLKAVPIPPHFQYFCVACAQDFSTAERAPWTRPPTHNPMQPYFCDQCAFVENRRTE